MVKKAAAILLILLFALSAPGCGKNEKTRYDAQFLQLFDTKSELVAYMDSKEEFTDFSNLIYNNLKEYDHLYDIYNNYPGINNLKTINDNAGKKPVRVDKRIIGLLQLARKEDEATNGSCNVAFGAVLRLWHQYREDGINDPEHAQLPPMEELKEASKHTDINQVIIDEKASTVYLKDPEMSLDVGAVAKGYATEQVAELAEKAGYSSALLSIGGNVRAIGEKGIHQELWNVGIQNPDLGSEKTSLTTVLLREQSLVTSGIYERYYTVNGKNYHHIIDPKTLMPSAYYKSVSIITRDSGVADALSTALFNMPPAQGMTYIESLSGTEALWVMPDGRIQYSSHFHDLEKS
ncbi:ApbE family protein [Caprobacter fermentans]|uniref:FAD:protein FMN transferase n=1 Tax=Caproicibacter fermentans TaxID=2576756 RepID=A0A6N8I0Y5_9FIRM|nr:FAD:protein FMN transferase [Caproicibacter fermentans]MVB11784.1 ApbE family protein [Caproicibacter fermentans]